MNIKTGDLVTLKGLNKQKEKPIGIVKRTLDSRTYEIFGSMKVWQQDFTSRHGKRTSLRSD